MGKLRSQKRQIGRQMEDLRRQREEFAAIAEDKGRNPEIAKAFVDRDIEIAGIVEQGKLLTLTPQRAVDLGIEVDEYDILRRREDEAIALD